MADIATDITWDGDVGTAYGFFVNRKPSIMPQPVNPTYTVVRIRITKGKPEIETTDVAETVDGGYVGATVRPTQWQAIETAQHLAATQTNK